MDFRRESETILVPVVRRAWRHRCPYCHFTTRATYHRHPREWRQVSLGRWRVVVVSTSHRIACPEHGVVNEAFPWAAPGSLFTLDFESFVAWLVQRGACRLDEHAVGDPLALRRRQRGVRRSVLKA